MQTDRETIIKLLVITAIVILFLIIAGIVLLLLYSKKIYTHQKSIAKLKAEFDNALLNTQLEIQEQTLEHISREIHDNIGLSLTLSKLNLNTLDYNQSDILKIKIKESINLITTAIYDLSSISHSLNSDTVKKNGLVKALEEELSRIRRSCGITIEFSTVGEPLFLDNQVELVLFRISQEALNNSLKHSNASLIEIILNFMIEGLSLSIQDNGNGFNPEETKRRTGAGLLNMAARAKLIAGTCDISSNENLGTTVTIRIKYQERDKK